MDEEYDTACIWLGQNHSLDIGKYGRTLHHLGPRSMFYSPHVTLESASRDVTEHVFNLNFAFKL
jgi:hypothetical protein